ncbi:MAG TPA: DEAD/DEAH box helicase [Patescibacteria group bacterium]|nr:DEAD/DEAH box helicase [Patescibacteria group bacterium]
MSYSQHSRPHTRGRTQHTNYSRPASRGPKKEYINPSRFIRPVTVSAGQEIYEPTHVFSDFAVHPLLMTNLLAMGFAAPSAIQDQTIPVGLSGKDVVGIANTGTGKTIAFALPVLDKLLNNPNTNAIIMAPTRELAQQIEVECRSLARGSGIRGAILIGGVAMGPQLRDLRARPRIVIGTPGRIKDHLEQGTLKLDNFNIIVLDEVDRMLDMGFIVDIRHILGRAAAVRQSFFFSATMDARVTAIIESFANDPVNIMVKTGDTSENVDQNIVRYSAKSEKIGKLHDLLVKDDVVKTLVFDDTHRSVERLCKELQARGFEADAIHGGKSQSQRQRALKRFKDNNVNVLVATDVAARGIDITDISHVINYSTPQSYGDYVHRIGRTGRAGKQGYALTFIEA